MKYLLGLFLFASFPANADSLDYKSVRECIERGRAALFVANSIAAGLPLDRIHLTYSRAPKTEDEFHKWEDDFLSIKQITEREYLALSEGTPKRAERAAQRVMELCAYEYGKRTYLQTKAASSNILRAGSAGEYKCRQKLMDHAVIGNARAHGMPREDLESRATMNREQFGEERYANVMRLIDEAYHAEDIQAWFDTHWSKCIAE